MVIKQIGIKIVSPLATQISTCRALVSSSQSDHDISGNLNHHPGDDFIRHGVSLGYVNRDGARQEILIVGPGHLGSSVTFDLPPGVIPGIRVDVGQSQNGHRREVAITGRLNRRVHRGRRRGEIKIDCVKIGEWDRLNGRTRGAAGAASSTDFDLAYFEPTHYGNP